MWPLFVVDEEARSSLQGSVEYDGEDELGHSVNSLQIDLLASAPRGETEEVPVSGKQRLSIVPT